MKGFQASEWKCLESDCIFQNGEVPGVLPGCALDCKIHKGNIQADSVAAQESHVFKFSSFQLFKGHARSERTLLRILA